jgi:hypothetical protein
MTEGEYALNADTTLPEASATHHSSASRQFNFWLGEWDLTWQDGGRGTNSIRAILDGNVIFESFDASPTDTFKGMSFSVFNLALGKWQQTWVDNRGNYLDFVGTYLDGKMTLERVVTLAEKTIKQRMVFYNITDTSLDWIWERSEGQGAAWEPLWQIHYQRRSGL